MPEEASMSFKVYLDMGGGRQEVRRFGLAESVATNYMVLRDKVCGIFGLPSHEAVLSWKDSEGDSITISSDDELMEAVADSLGNQSPQLVRINVTVSNTPSTNTSGHSEQNSSGPQGNQQGDIHPGVVCDGCNGSVQGIRYRCVTCPDFDLCGACETKGLHKEHKMMRMPKPRDAGEPWFFWKEKEDGPGHFSTHFGMHGGDHGGFSSSFSGCGGGGASSGPGPFGGAWAFGGPRGGHCHRGRHGGRGRGGWPGWWGRAWGGKNWGGSGQGQTTGSGTQQQQQSSQDSNQSQQQSQSQSQPQQAQSQQQQSSSDCSGQGGCAWVGAQATACPFMGEDSAMPNPEQVAEEAKKMAEQMAKQAAEQAAHQAHHFASHYASDQLANVMRGIWTAWSGQQGPNATSSSSTSYSTSHSQSSSTSSDAPQQGASEGTGQGEGQNTPRSVGENYLRKVGESVASMLDPLGIDVEVNVEHNGIRQRCSLGENASSSPRSNGSSTPANTANEQVSSAASEASLASVNLEKTEGPSTSSDKCVEAMDVASPPESTQADGGQMEAHSGSPDPEDWTMVNQDSSSEPTSAAQANPKPPAPERVSYPSLTELTPHPDPKIQQSLEQMSAMGYSNEGGWLTNLLEMKQGDINQVLDLLQPVNK